MSFKRATARRKAKAPKKPEGFQDQRIQLCNPVSQHFRSWAIGNALVWERLAHDQLIRHAPDAAQALEPYGGLLAYYASDFTDRELFEKWTRFREAVDTRLPDNFVVRENQCEGQTLTLCGAGPSLADNAEEFCRHTDQLWGCNSALPWLVDHGYPVTHGVTVDQTPEMCAEWVSKPDVEYLLSSTVHPNLSNYLKDGGRRIRFFHNYVGMQGPIIRSEDREMMYEDWLYSALFAPTLRCGSGLNSVNRALDVAMYMGFSKIRVLGADCALRCARPAPEDAEIGSPKHRRWLEQDVVMHADGGNALASGATPVTLGGEIDGRHWETKPDMIISAVWLVKQMQNSGGRIELVGDTLPNAIKDKPDEFLARLPSLVDANDVPVEILTRGYMK